MLGLSAGLSYRELNDFKTSNDYIRYMFNDIKGLFAHACFKNDAFIQYMKRFNGLFREKFEGNSDTFVSMNSFCINKREVSYIKRLNACYVDIDCYKLGLSKEAVIFQLEEDYFGSKIPVPTFIIDSGNGLYLIWKLRNEDKNALPRWRRVQNYLCETLKSLGADSACTDAARVLRVPFTVNTKNGEKVRIVEFNDLTFSLYDITNEFDIKVTGFKKNKNKVTHPYGTATQSMRDYSTKIAEIANKELPDFNSYEETSLFISKNKKAYEKKFGKKKPTFSRKKQLRGRCKDLETLYTMRHGEDCKRELGLFLYRHWLFECTKNSDLALNKTLELNNKMDHPLDPNYVIKRTSSAEKKIKEGEFYNYSIAGIIRTLEITEDEMTHLSFIVPSKNSNDKRKDINKKSYLKRLLKQGKEPKKTKIQKRQEEIEKLIARGEDRATICSILSISKATYQRDLTAIKERQEAKKLAEKMNVESKKETVMSIAERLRIMKEKLKKYRVSFFNTINYKSSVATARLRLALPRSHFNKARFVFFSPCLDTS